MEPAVGTLSSRAVGPASHLLARAFAADPVITTFLADPRRRALAFPAFFRSVLHSLLPQGHVYSVTLGRLAGVAAWSPPVATAPPRRAERRAQLSLLAVRALFPHALPKLLEGFHRLEALHPVEPHWYLAFVGIEPSLQSRGLGGRLLAPVLAEADANRTVCYLETPFPETHGFYRRLGFEVVSAEAAFAGAPPVATMLRRPR